MEFYFKLEDLKQLIDSNPDAKGIIISHEVKRLKDVSKNITLDLSLITAYVQDPKLQRGEPIPQVPGCPYPPGCTDDTKSPTDCLSDAEEAEQAIAQIKTLIANNFNL